MPFNKILPLRSRLEVQNRWLEERLNTIIPEIMQRESFDMWIILCREYNEDPVVMSLLPEPAMSARRRSILMFILNDNGTVDRLNLGRYTLGDLYDHIWDPKDETQFDCLKRIVEQHDPQRIGINFSRTFAFGDGLSKIEYDNLALALGETYMKQTESAERLCVGWLERRIKAELVVYSGIVEIGHAIIAEAFSTRVIHPGITTTQDVVWWMRQKMLDLGLRAWFQPDIEIQAPGQTVEFESKQEKRHLILPGDLLWCDMGFKYLGLATDQQQHAYVLKPGETDAPDGLKAALQDGNQLQDLLINNMQPGKTGNEVLQATRQQALNAGLTPNVYAHPLGYHGHAAGPTIGLWDQQDGVPGSGDYELFDYTCYSIELNVMKAIPEWDNQQVRIALEEDAVLRESIVQWLDGRQTELHLIG